MLDVVLFKIW